MTTSIYVRTIDRAHAADLKLPNEPFSLFGRMVPRLENGDWSYAEELFSQTSEMVFPNEDYDFDALERNGVCIGAYADAECIGLAVLQRAWFRYLYLYDLKVNRGYRGCGIGHQLMEACKAEALRMGYRGIYTIGQDNNLAACRFYLKEGFSIGGFDNRAYDGTGQQGKADITFYWDK